MTSDRLRHCARGPVPFPFPISDEPQQPSFRALAARDKVNTQSFQPLIDASTRLARSDFPDFNDPNKLGQGKEMVDRLTDLISIFQNPELDFSKNRSEHDDILGDAYEQPRRNPAAQPLL